MIYGIIRTTARIGAYVGAVVFLATGAVTACTGGLVIGGAFMLLALCIAVAVWDKPSAKIAYPTHIVGDFHYGMPEKPDWKGFKKTVDRVQR